MDTVPNPMFCPILGVFLFRVDQIIKGRQDNHYEHTKNQAYCICYLINGNDDVSICDLKPDDPCGEYRLRKGFVRAVDNRVKRHDCLLMYWHWIVDMVANGQHSTQALKEEDELAILMMAKKLRRRHAYCVSTCARFSA